mmetsp:Transcript_43377/g.129564  ORF Transcript_43377/g.129564 Transcript_43377/m.129564 type:complete len:258 (+) Transcript_43377:212-985(+)
MKTLLPAAKALDSASEDGLADTMMTGRSWSSSRMFLRICWHTSKPDIPGIMTSKSTQSGRSLLPHLRRYFRAASPSMAMCTWYCGIRTRSTTIWLTSSSSTESSRGFFLVGRTFFCSITGSDDMDLACAAWGSGRGKNSFLGDGRRSLPCSSSPMMVGNRTPKVVPMPTSESTWIRPPWSLTTSFAMDSPRPTPSKCLASEFSSCSKGWKMRWSESGGIPRPVSVTSTSTHRPAGSFSAEIAMLPFTVNLQAFVMML